VVEPVTVAESWSVPPAVVDADAGVIATAVTGALLSPPPEDGLEVGFDAGLELAVFPDATFPAQPVVPRRTTAKKETVTDKVVLFLYAKIM